eukprot:Hpha_TRINITY_DN16017_c0_g1::TRINITY_DN16017_c0_g1_i1::g.118002::m.118002
MTLNHPAEGVPSWPQVPPGPYPFAPPHSSAPFQPGAGFVPPPHFWGMGFGLPPYPGHAVLEGREEVREVQEVSSPQGAPARSSPPWSSAAAQQGGGSSSSSSSTNVRSKRKKRRDPVPKSPIHPDDEPALPPALLPPPQPTEAAAPEEVARLRALLGLGEEGEDQDTPAWSGATRLSSGALRRALFDCNGNAERCAEWLRLRAEWRAIQPFGTACDLPPPPRVAVFLEHSKGAFRVLEGNGLPLVWCQLRAFSDLAAAAATGLSRPPYRWNSSAPRCHGDPRITLGVFAFWYAWRRAIVSTNAQQAVVLLDCRGLRRPPTALLQRLSAIIGDHPCQLNALHGLVAWPLTHTTQQEFARAQRWVDIGGVLETKQINMVNDVMGYVTHLADRLRLLGVDPAHAERVGSEPFRRGDRPRRARATPWYPEGAPIRTSLEEEMADFAVFALPSSSERARRLAYRGQTQKAVESCGVVTVKLIGPDAHGFGLKSDPVYLAAECADPDSAERDLQNAGMVAMKKDVPSELHSEGPTRPHIQITGDDGVDVELVFGMTAAAARRSASFEKQMLYDFAPGAATAFILIRSLLGQAGLCDETAGGLGRGGLLMMVFHVCQQLGPEPQAPATAVHHVEEAGRRPMNAERVLRRFLRYYGKDFEFHRFTVDPSSPTPTPKLHPSDAVSITGPGWPGANLSAMCTQIEGIRQYLARCERMLEKGDARGDAESKKTTRLSELIWPHQMLPHQMLPGQGQP